MPLEGIISETLYVYSIWPSITLLQCYCCYELKYGCDPCTIWRLKNNPVPDNKIIPQNYKRTANPKAADLKDLSPDNKGCTYQ
jgi:hypothetical protein